MNLFKITPRFSRSKQVQDPTEATRAIANRLYQNRQKLKRPGDADSDWAKAERIVKSPIRRGLFRLNQPLIRAEKEAVEPVANWVDRADLFRIIERLSPTIEAFGVIMGAIAIPLVLYFAAQSYEERQQQQELERVQQQAVTDYLNQLSTILLDLDGSLSDPHNAELRTLTTATTLTLLRDPNLNGARKGQIIEFLFQMDLVQKDVVYGPQRPEDMIPIISLRSANLPYADLSAADLPYVDLSAADLSAADLFNANLSGANLSGANLNAADLSAADLFNANLSGANLSGANLNAANLPYADLPYVDLSAADLSAANLFNADLFNADLSVADLSAADLSAADLSATRNLTKSQLENAYLCETQFPSGIDLDSNRDCSEVWAPFR